MPGANVQLTRATRGVLVELVADPAAEHHVTQLVTGTGLSAGEIYPVLARLEAVHWLESGWDPPTTKQQGWPRRRHYRLSADGLAMARGALASAAAVPRGRLRPAADTA
ncbi:PadR family transcriptional regulator [Nakamurella sp. GG22]